MTLQTRSNRMARTTRTTRTTRLWPATEPDRPRSRRARRAGPAGLIAATVLVAGGVAAPAVAAPAAPSETRASAAEAPGSEAPGIEVSDTEASGIEVSDTEAARASGAPHARAPRCTGENRPGRLVTVRGMPTATRTTARAVLAAAVRCQSRELARRAEHDGTRLSFGIVTPREFFALPEKETKYRYLVDALVKSRPGYEKLSGYYVWPRVSTARGARDPKAWDEAVSAGLLTRAQARDMRAQGSGYLGWRVLIDADGGWGAFIGGD